MHAATDTALWGTPRPGRGTLGGDGRDKDKDSDKGGPFGAGIFALLGGPGGTSFPATPMVTGGAALILLATGGWMLRRRPEVLPVRGSAVPTTE